ncbi:MAG: hypothetical protein R3F37_16540 [Candidatus Competibacteraceae bacterium]
MQQAGHTGTPGEMPELYLNPPGVAQIVLQTHHTTYRPTLQAETKQTLHLKAEAGGETVLRGRKPSTGTDCVLPLKVIVGNFKNHPGMQHDLIAEELGRSDDVYKLYYLQRFLNNNEGNDNLFDQYSPFYKEVFGRRFGKELVCASVCVLSGEVLFGQVHAARGKWNNLGAHRPLYKRLSRRPNSKSQIIYDQQTVRRARDAIARSLQRGIPVRVGCAWNSLLTYDFVTKRLDPTKGGGHTVLIVGCNNSKDRFLYIDPCKGMSKLKYEGGIVPTGVECDFLGLFRIESSGLRGPVFKSDSLEVLECPTQLIP